MRQNVTSLNNERNKTKGWAIYKTQELTCVENTC